MKAIPFHSAIFVRLNPSIQSTNSAVPNMAFPEALYNRYLGGVLPREYLRRVIRASFTGLRIDPVQYRIYPASPVARLNIKRLKTACFLDG